MTRGGSKVTPLCLPHYSRVKSEWSVPAGPTEPEPGPEPEAVCLCLPGSLPAVQVLPQPVLPGGGVLPVRPGAEDRIPVHVLGPSGRRLIVVVQLLFSFYFILCNYVLNDRNILKTIFL